MNFNDSKEHIQQVLNDNFITNENTRNFITRLVNRDKLTKVNPNYSSTLSNWYTNTKVKTDTLDLITIQPFESNSGKTDLHSHYICYGCNTLHRKDIQKKEFLGCKKCKKPFLKAELFINDPDILENSDIK